MDREARLALLHERLAFLVVADVAEPDEDHEGTRIEARKMRARREGRDELLLAQVRGD